MKTPWRFLADLSSRRRPAKAQESAIGHDTDPGTLEREADPTPTRPSLSAKPSVKADDDKGTPVDQVPVASSAVESDPHAARALESAVVEEPRSAAPDDESDHSRAEADMSAPRNVTGKQQNKPAVKRRAPGKKAKAGVAAQSAIAALEDPRSQPSASRDSFFNDVASLDEDIKKLRSQLAQKLDLQNAQLRKMLERFGVS